MNIFLASVSETATEWIDIISGVIGARWAEILGWCSISVLAPILINQGITSIRGWISSAKKKKADLKIAQKIENGISVVANATETLTATVTNVINSGFDSITLKNEKAEALKQEINQKAIAKIIAGNEKANLVIANSKEILLETAEEVNTKADEVIEKVEEVVDTAETITEKVVEKVGETVNKEEIVKVVKRVVKRG